jgi:hypothetical protein
MKILFEDITNMFYKINKRIRKEDLINSISETALNTHRVIYDGSAQQNFICK